jgi:hypothetical protein
MAGMCADPSLVPCCCSFWQLGLYCCVVCISPAVSAVRVVLCLAGCGDIAVGGVFLLRTARPAAELSAHCMLGLYNHMRGVLSSRAAC